MADQYIEDVVLHVNCNGADTSTTFTDESKGGHTLTANGDAQVDTAQSKFGGASLLLDGTGDYLSLSDSSDFNFGSEEFTVEFWLRITSSDVGSSRMIENAAWDDSLNGWTFSMVSGDPAGARRLAIELSQIGTDIFSDVAIPLNSWNPIAFVREGDTLYLYINGVKQEDTADATGNTFNSEGLRIGASLDALTLMAGRLDEIRLTKGVARYTANYTPATVAFDEWSTWSLTNANLEGNLSLTQVESNLIEVNNTLSNNLELSDDIFILISEIILDIINISDESILTFDEILSEVINLISSHQDSAVFIKTISSVLNLSTSFILKEILNIVETINIDSSSTGSMITNQSIADVFSFIDKLNIQLVTSITEDLFIDETLIPVKKIFEGFIEVIQEFTRKNS